MRILELPPGPLVRGRHGITLLELRLEQGELGRERVTRNCCAGRKPKARAAYRQPVGGRDEREADGSDGDDRRDLPLAYMNAVANSAAPAT